MIVQRLGNMQADHEQVARFVAATGVDSDQASFFLEACGGDLQRAVELYAGQALTTTVLRAMGAFLFNTQVADSCSWNPKLHGRLVVQLSGLLCRSSGSSTWGRVCQWCRACAASCPACKASQGPKSPNTQALQLPVKAASDTHSCSFHQPEVSWHSARLWSAAVYSYHKCAAATRCSQSLAR